ncbi:antibiotic biosynthesis monooxygenase family protein [Glaciimonas soli]|uniref:Antibiotic biosynthesis monooxygenase n=1 Tax=Glaciimonas soli TaxID=2590999 RepID=A0A843YMU5_9BURK|nr:antibiotic biosynthesis monooxygenase family protein [Glaciimonas soli]MQQ99296.1 antibiotic biosynthesis monooxygenase [Glaciimonas soli]
MLLEYIRYKISRENATLFVDAYALAAKELDKSEHCLGYDLSQCSEDPESFILRIQWDSLDGHINGFRKSAGFGPFFAAIKPYFNNIQEMQHYEATKVLSKNEQ